MPNEITTSGLTIKTITEVIADLTASLQATYGDDINVSQNSPDGQLINIFAQAVIDNLELLADIYNTFSIESAYGTILDQRVALNGIARVAGTYTVTPVTITVDRALTLTGLDALDSDPTAVVFTVSDDAGNQFQLVTTKIFSASGSSSLDFQSSVIGQIETTLNSITNQVTSTLGVTAVNNPSAVTTLGVDEETDAQLKIRHAASFKLASTGPADAVRAAVLSADNVVDAYVVENATSAPVSSVPANSLWVIANGGTDADVAAAIYSKKAPGCGLYGSVSVTVTRPQGNSASISFDRAVTENLYIKFSIVARYTGAAWDTTAIKTALVSALAYSLGQTATIGDIVLAMSTITPQGYLVSVGVSSDGITYGDNLVPTTAKYYFVLDTGRITIS